MKYVVDNCEIATKYFKRSIDRYMDSRAHREANVNGDMDAYKKFSRECDERMCACFNIFEGAEVVFEDGKAFTIRTLADVMNIGIKARH